MLIPSPLRQRLIPRPSITPTPLPHNPPRPRPDNVLHALLHPDHARQLFRPRFSREESRRVRVQPFIHHPFPVLLLLGLPDRRLRVVRIRRGRYQSAVAEYLRPRLPGGKQHLVFEFLARRGVDLPGQRARGAQGGGGWVEAGARGGDEGVEVLGYGVVDGGSGDS